MDNCILKIKSKTGLNQFLPKALKNLTDEKIIYNDKVLKNEYIIDIIHFFLIKYHLFKEDIINLSSIKLREKYGTNYNNYFDYLLDCNIIYKVSEYSVGVKCRSFKLNEIYYNDIFRYFNTNKVLLKKYKNRQLNYLNVDDISNKLIDDLYRITIDKDKAMEQIKNVNKSQMIKNSISINQIYNEEIYFSWDNYGRFHTNFTTLKKSIRNNCVKIDNSKIVELDIKNSQPLFFLSILPKKEIGQEYYLWLNLVKSGDFYKYIFHKYYKCFKIKLSKNKIKRLTYVIFFGKNDDNKINRFFRALFPKIYDFIIKIKHENGDYRWLAHELQRIESSFVFNKLVKNIKNDKDVPLFTVHDSIFFKSSDYEYVEPIFNKNINEFIESIS
jgi:hypothetical protein